MQILKFEIQRESEATFRSAVFFFFFFQKAPGTRLYPGVDGTIPPTGSVH